MTNQAYRIARLFSAALDPAKMEVLLLKIRKSEGKITTLTWSQITDVLLSLDPGWKVEKTVGIVKMYGRHDGSETPVHFFEDNKALSEKKYAEVKKAAVTSLPSKPKANELYVLDLTPLEQKGTDYEFRFRPWMGAEGWSITTSNGKVIEVLPDAYDFGEFYHGYKEMKRTKIQTYRWVPVLNKETDWLSQIDKKLGLGAFEKTAPRTREKTGSCPVCFSNIKIGETDKKMVLHGYMRPGTGSTHGKCFGVGYQAFEVSVEGTKDYLKAAVEPAYKSAQLKSEKLHRDDLQVLSYGSDPTRPTVVTPDDPRWAYHLDTARKMADQLAAIAEAEFRAFTKLVSNWKERPLPKEGEKHIDWYFKGQTG